MLFSLNSATTAEETIVFNAQSLIYALGIALIVLSVALVVVILFQSAKDKRLSGAIAGGTETFFGKSRAKTADRVLSKVTIVLSVLTVLVTVALVVILNCVPAL